MEITFEKALSELQEITQKLERSDVDLEQSVSLFERGIELSDICSKKLNDAKQKIIKLDNAKKEVEND